jgi:hypothetical protein
VDATGESAGRHAAALLENKTAERAPLDRSAAPAVRSPVRSRPKEPTMTRESLPLVFDCPMNWNAMSGGDQRRYCGECRKHVTDLSACGNAAEARRLLEASGPSPCIRYTSDSAGRVVFRGPRTSLGALALLASMAAAAGCETQAATVETVQAVEMSAPPSVETAPARAAPVIPAPPVHRLHMGTWAPHPPVRP